MENSLYNNLSGISGGLALWWVDEVSVDCGHISKNIIDSVVKVDSNGRQMFISWICGDPNFGRRALNWNRLRGIVVNQ